VRTQVRGIRWFHDCRRRKEQSDWYRDRWMVELFTNTARKIGSLQARQRVTESTSHWHSVPWVLEANTPLRQRRLSTFQASFLRTLLRCILVPLDALRVEAGRLVKSALTDSTRVLSP
jgi:hypothetical protein